MATLTDLEAYADGASANLIALAVQILSGDDGSGLDALGHHAACAHAIAGLLKAFPFHAARGQLFVPIELLDRYGADRQEVMAAADNAAIALGAGRFAWLRPASSPPCPGIGGHRVARCPACAVAWRP